RCLRSGPQSSSQIYAFEPVSELVTGTDRIPSELIFQAEQLQLRPSVDADVFARQVDRFKGHREVVVEVVTDAQVELLVRLGEARVARSTLVGRREELVAPVPGQA